MDQPFNPHYEVETFDNLNFYKGPPGSGKTNALRRLESSAGQLEQKTLFLSALQKSPAGVAFSVSVEKPQVVFIDESCIANERHWREVARELPDVTFHIAISI